MRGYLLPAVLLFAGCPSNDKTYDDDTDRDTEFGNTDGRIDSIAGTDSDPDESDSDTVIITPTDTETDTDGVTSTDSDSDSDSDTDGVLPTDSDTDVVFPVDALEPGDLVITEIMVSPAGCTAAQGQFFEFKNASGAQQNLRGLIIDGGGAQWQLTTDVIVNHGDYVIAAPLNASGCAYNISPDIRYDAAVSVTSGSFEVANASHTLDAVNYTAWDVSGLGLGVPTPPGYTMQLLVETAVANDTIGGWCLAGTLLFADNYASLRQPATTCYEPPDTDPTDVETDTDDGIVTVPELDTGDLVITEFMVDPDGCANAAGQYIEVLNTLAEPVDIFGLVIGLGGTFSTLNSHVLIAPGGRAIGRADWPAFCTYSGITADFIYNRNLVMSSTGGQITLQSQIPVVIDSVNYTGWNFGYGTDVFAEGYALQLQIEDASDNDLEASWCLGSTPFSAGNFGTPKAVANACGELVIVDTDTDIVRPTDDTEETDDTDTDTDSDYNLRQLCLDTIVRTPASGLSAVELCPGDLIITELMILPGDAGASTSRAQYIEIYNASGFAVFPEDLIVDVYGQTGNNQLGYSMEVLAGGDASIPAGERGVVMMRSFNSYWHAFDRDYRMNDTSFGLINHARIQLSTGAFRVDEVDYTNWSLSSSKSLEFKYDTALTPDDRLNDDPLDWCAGTTLLTAVPGNPTAFDKGTPGEANTCP